MPRIIFTSRYLKGRTEKQVKNFVKYIATRPNAEKYSLEEYEDLNNMENGEIKNYVGYLAKRPHAEKIGKEHALWNGSDDYINLSQVAKETANHKGNIWTNVISLKREDAERLGYNNAVAWRDLVRQKSAEMAKEMKIPLENFVYYGAFHNEGNHPHIHVMCYSKNPKEGYLTKKGIENLRRSFALEIFHNDLYEIYDQKDEMRNELKKYFDDKVKNAVKKENKGNEKAEELLWQLSENLKNSNHKKVYGRLDKENKLLVDEIINEMSKDEKVQNLYEGWLGLKNDILATYQDKVHAQKSICDESEFRNIKNIVVKYACEMGSDFSSESRIYRNESLQTFRKQQIKKTYMRLLKSLSRMIENNYNRQKSYVSSTDKKILRKILEKKQSHGQKI